MVFFNAMILGDSAPAVIENVIDIDPKEQVLNQSYVLESNEVSFNSQNSD